MKRIIVIGASGAGKSTLARDLSKQLGIPHTELDSLYHGENWQSLDITAFKQKVDAITKGEQWILCGNYFQKLGGLDLWKKADTVIWCDYPFRKVLAQLLGRTLRRTISREELWNGNRESFRNNFFTRDSVIFHLLKTFRKQKRRYAPIFNDKPESLVKIKLIRLTSREDIKAKLGL